MKTCTVTTISRSAALSGHSVLLYLSAVLLASSVLLEQCLSTPGRDPVPGPGINYTGSREVFLEVVILVLTCICLTTGVNLLTPSTVTFVTSSQRGLTCVGAECGKEGGGDGPYIRRGAE